MASAAPVVGAPPPTAPAAHPSDGAAPVDVPLDDLSDPSGGLVRDLARQLARDLDAVVAAAVRAVGAQAGVLVPSAASGRSGRGPRLPGGAVALGGRHRGDPAEGELARHVLLLGEAAAGTGVLHVQDLAGDARGLALAREAGARAQDLTARSLLVVPVTAAVTAAVAPRGDAAGGSPGGADGGELVGHLVLGHRSPSRFDDRARLTAIALAAHAGSLVEGSRLRGEAEVARRSARAAERHVHLLTRVADLVGGASAQDLPVRLGAAVAVALGCSDVQLELSDPDAGGPRHPELSRSAAGGATWSVPLVRGGGAARGVLHARWADEGAADPWAQPVLTAVAALVAGELERVDLEVVRARAVEASRRAARSPLPPHLPELDRVAAAVAWVPAPSSGRDRGPDDVGGDWYDVVDGGDGSVTAVLGSVLGRGSAATELAAQLRALVRGAVLEGHDPATALARTSAVLRGLGTDLTATCVLVALDQASGSLRAASAGHPLPQVLTSTRAQTLPVVAGPALGAQAAPRYACARAELGAATRLVLHSEGALGADDPGAGALVRAAAPRPGPDGDTPRAAADRVLAATAPRRRDAALLVLDYTGPEDAAGPPCRAVLAPELESVRRARALVRGATAAWGLRADAGDAVELVVSELVTNAVAHTREECELEVTHERAAGLVRVAVRDASSRHPLPRRAGSQEQGGRGLAIVEVLSRAWGVQQLPGGKSVWAVLPAG